jgi:hypothetical protein
VWVNAGSSIAASVALWGVAVLLCCGVKWILPAPPLVQLILGGVIFAGFALIHVRGPILCASDRDILLRLFPGKEMRLLRLLGLVSPALGAPSAR